MHASIPRTLQRLCSNYRVNVVASRADVVEFHSRICSPLLRLEIDGICFLTLGTPLTRSRKSWIICDIGGYSSRLLNGGTQLMSVCTCRIVCGGRVAGFAYVEKGGRRTVFFWVEKVGTFLTKSV